MPAFFLRRNGVSLVLILGLLFLPAALRAQVPEIYLQLGFKTADDFGEGRKIVFSPDGSLLAAASGGSAIRIWETATGRELQTLSGHTGVVKCLAFLPDGRRLVSGSRDKTVRLWDIDTGRLIRTFWGHQDEVRSIDVSPDGSILGSVEGLALRIWNLDSGGLLAAIPAPVDPGSTSGYVPPLRSVGCSPDSSKVLFTTLRGDVIVAGVKERRILKTFSGQKLSSYWTLSYLSFTPEGRMLFVGQGLLVTIDPDRMEAVVKRGPEGMAFQSPDGAMQVAEASSPYRLRVFDAEAKERRVINLRENVTSVGYGLAKGLAAVSSMGDHLDLYDLATGRAIRDFGSPAREIHGSAFSADGAFLSMKIQVPGQGSKDPIETLVERWNLAGASLEKSYNFNAFHHELTKLFKSGDQFAIEKASRMVKEESFYNASPEVFSDYDSRNRCFYFVDVPLGSIFGDSGSPDITIFRIDAKDEMDIDAKMSHNRPKWRIHRQFKAHVQAVTARAVSYRNDLLATGSTDKTINLFRYSDQTLIRSFKGHQGAITELTLSPDGKRLLSESRDVTARLWDVGTGRELARFVHFADGEWIVITPEGYYNASLNGDRYMNVRVGASVYGIENYREAFFRPDLVKMALSGVSMEGFKTLADVKQPPRLSIVQTPATTSAEDFRVTLRLEDRGGGIGDVRLYLDGSAVLMDSGRGLKVVQKEEAGAVYRSYGLRLSPGTHTIRAAAFNADNTMQSNEATHRVVASFASLHKPSLHALVVGIQDFRNPKLSLKYAVADANLFADTLRQGAQGLFEQVKITSLSTREATTREGVISALQGFKAIHPDDVFILYLASHGTVDEGEYFLITSNVGALSTQRLKADALSQGMLKELVANIPSTKKLIIIDTCNAGQLGQAMQTALLTRGMSEDTAMKVLSRAVGSTILSASTSVQEALEGYQGHGLFTWTLTQGMLGRADKGKSGLIHTTELAAYVESEVPDLAEQVFKHAQFPTVSISGQGFPVGRVK
ncbi:caspase family protein [Holophaga foetida]|uniref:WD40 domain-containing protein n=1 Tax=Holophaga foetida TaxID=35839 RepID=UPI00024717E1|nr:caspase family protein [Holophaga foetida]